MAVLQGAILGLSCNMYTVLCDTFLPSCCLGTADVLKSDLLQHTQMQQLLWAPRLLHRAVRVSMGTLLQHSQMHNYR